MPIHHRKYRDADDRQHSGLGSPSEPRSNPKSQSLYDEAAREYRLLMSQGKNYDPSGNRGSNPCPRNFRMAEDRGRDGILREQKDVSEPTGNEGRSGREVHTSPIASAGEVHGSYERGSSLAPLFTEHEVRFPASVHLVIVGAAISLVLLCWGAAELLGYIWKAVQR